MLFTNNERMCLFLFGCIPTRIIISLLPYILLSYDMKIMTNIFIFILFSIGLSFIVLYMNSWRLQAPEGGGVTWWKNFRWLHGILYILASCMLYYLNNYSCGDIQKTVNKYINNDMLTQYMKCNSNKAYYLPSGLLLLDTFIGLILFILHHFC